MIVQNVGTQVNVENVPPIEDVYTHLIVENVEHPEIVEHTETNVNVEDVDTQLIVENFETPEIVKQVETRDIVEHQVNENPETVENVETPKIVQLPYIRKRIGQNLNKADFENNSDDLQRETRESCTCGYCENYKCYSKVQTLFVYIFCIFCVFSIF